MLFDTIIEQDLLTINPYSRKGSKLDKVDAIVIHWVANPKTTAKQNRNYFESLKDKKDRYASAHYIIDDNTIIQCIPDDEVAWHVGSSRGYTNLAKTRWGARPYMNNNKSPNFVTLGIELCHDEWDGKFSADVLTACKALCVDLCNKHELNPMTDILMHYNITGKDCPKYFVNNKSEFDLFKIQVKKFMNPALYFKNIPK